jgi:hypothetical protein
VDGFGTTLIDNSASVENERYGLGQNASLLRDPQLMQVAPTRDDLAAKRLTDSTAPMYARIPTATSRALVFEGATTARTNTESVLRGQSMRPVGPAQHVVGDYEDFQFHPTIVSNSSDARGGRGGDTSLQGAWRYPYSEVGTVAAAGLVTSQLNYQENQSIQSDIASYAESQGDVVMPGATQMHGYSESGIFKWAGNAMGALPAARTQGVLSVVPASGAVIRGNDYLQTSDAMTALDGIEDRTIQGERILAHDQRLNRLRAYRAPTQFK